jgi:hypothetical protein
MLQKEPGGTKDLMTESSSFPSNPVGTFREENTESVTEKEPAGQVNGADFLGISGSLLCLLHCLAPQLATFGLLGAGLGSFFAGEFWAVIFWATCFWAVYRSAASSIFPRNKLLLWLAFLIFSAGLGLEFFSIGGKWVSYTGSVLLVIAHILNFLEEMRWRKMVCSAS